MLGLQLCKIEVHVRDACRPVRSQLRVSYGNSSRAMGRIINNSKMHALFVMFVPNYHVSFKMGIIWKQVSRMLFLELGAELSVIGCPLAFIFLEVIDEHLS